MKHYDCNVITFETFYLFTIQLYLILIKFIKDFNQYALGQCCHNV
jgi:hypothetical protein